MKKKMITKKLSEMSLEELWVLFPINLTEHQSEWASWYAEEERYLRNLFPKIGENYLIHHIGSTAIDEIKAKPIVDILVEVPDTDTLQKFKEVLGNAGYLCMSETHQRVSLNKGYTPQGFAEKVFHLHLRLFGNHDEIYFRDYLKEHPEIAKEYEQLKQELSRRYKYDRDEYTRQKTAFVEKYTQLGKASH